MPLLLILFVLVPLTEVYLLAMIGARIGALPTLALVVVTGVIGASLARWQGLQVILAIQKDFREGRMPTDHMLSGMLVLVGAAFLLTPGVMTDAVGFLLMIPALRNALTGAGKKWVRARFNVEVHGWGPDHASPQDGSAAFPKEAQDVRIVDEEAS